MRIRTKMLAGYGVAFALLGVVLLWAIVNLVSLGRATDAILRENYRSIQAVQEMLQALNRQEKLARETLVGPAGAHTGEFRKQEAQFFQALAKAKDNITIPNEKGVLEGLETDYLAFLEKASNPGPWGPGDEQMIEDHYRALDAAVKRVGLACEELRTLNEEFMVSASSRAEQVARRAIWSTLAVGIVAVVLGIGFSLGFSTRLVDPIRKLKEATTRLTEGHYDVRVPVSRDDELGLLGNGFNVMAEKLGAFHSMNLNRLRAEQRKTDAVLRSISDAIVVLDAEFRITSLNPAAAALLDPGHEGAEGKHVLEVLQDKKVFEYVKQQAEAEPQARFPEEERILSIERASSVRYYLYDARPVKAEESRPLGTVLVLRDITRFRELDRMKSDFVMAASHELRTPMTGLEMSLGLLSEKLRASENSNYAQLLGAAHEELARLKALVSDLLDLSRLESGNIELQFVRLPLKPMADKTLSVFTNQAGERGITLSCDVPADLPSVKADPNKIAWVLSNLISNALRYVSDNGTIAVSAESAGDCVQVHVSDDGQGIPEEYQARIFDKFIQLKGTTDQGGTGLGLAISKEVIRAHRGVIWVDSQPDKGSTFTFTLPMFETQIGGKQ